MIASEYVDMFAVQAKERHSIAVRKSNVERQKESWEENLPSMKTKGPQASDEAAEMFGVSGRSVRDAQFVKKNDQELAEKVRNNEVSVSAAAKQLRATKTPQPTEEERAQRQTSATLKKEKGWGGTLTKPARSP